MLFVVIVDVERSWNSELLTVVRVKESILRRVGITSNTNPNPNSNSTWRVETVRFSKR